MTWLWKVVKVPTHTVVLTQNLENARRGDGYSIAAAGGTKLLAQKI